MVAQGDFLSLLRYRIDSPGVRGDMTQLSSRGTTVQNVLPFFSSSLQESGPSPPKHAHTRVFTCKHPHTRRPARRATRARKTESRPVPPSTAKGAPARGRHEGQHARCRQNNWNTHTHKRARTVMGIKNIDAS